jgi:hypothetical protein
VRCSMHTLLGVLAAAILLTGGTPTIAASATPSLNGGLGIQHDIRVVMRYYRLHPGKSAQYGGLWLKTERHPWRLVVMVTDDPPARPYPWERHIANPDQLRVRSAEFSLEYLRGIQHSITHAAENHQPWTRGICGVGVLVSENVVTIMTRGGVVPDGFWDHVHGRFPRRAFFFESGCPIHGASLASSAG